jgi:hypothetical protein
MENKKSEIVIECDTILNTKKNVYRLFNNKNEILLTENPNRIVREIRNILENSVGTAKN